MELGVKLEILYIFFIIIDYFINCCICNNFTKSLSKSFEERIFPYFHYKEESWRLDRRHELSEL